MAKKWIQAMNMKKGALHKTLDVSQGTKIPGKKMQEALNSRNPLTKKRAILAKTLTRFHK